MSVTILMYTHLTVFSKKPSTIWHTVRTLFAQQLKQYVFICCMISKGVFMYTLIKSERVKQSLTPHSHTTHQFGDESLQAERHSMQRMY